MSVDLAVELAAACLAGWAAWKTLPRAPALDLQRLFKVTLATVLRGEIEARDGDAEEWEAALASVPYHPAGREAEARLRDPRAAPVPVPALEGERALLQHLEAEPDPPARFRRMYREEPAALDALMSDPAQLGPDYDPASRFGPEADWDAVAAWSAPLQAGLARRLGHVLLVDLDSELAGALSEALPDGRLAALPPGSPEALLSALDGLLTAPSDRLILATRGRHVPAVLRALHAGPGLRDRTLAVLSLGGALRTAEDEAWLAQHFTHEQMEPELQRTLVYASVIDVDPAQPLARSWAAQRFDEPPTPASGRRTIEAVDLGPLVLSDLPPAALARAVWVLAGTLAAR